MKQSITLGSTVDDFTGDYLRQGGEKVNDNFDEVYSELGDASILHPAGAWKTFTAGLGNTTLNIALGAQHHINTAYGAVSVILPATTASDYGRICKISDVYGNWSTNNVVVDCADAATINGSSSAKTFNTNFSSVTFVYTYNGASGDWKYIPGFTHTDLVSDDSTPGVVTTQYVIGQDDIAGVIIPAGGYNPFAVDVYLNGVLQYYNPAQLGSNQTSDYGSGDITAQLIPLNGQNIKLRTGKYKTDDIVILKSYSSSIVAATPSYKRFSIKAYDVSGAPGPVTVPGQYAVRATYDPSYTTVEDNTFSVVDFGGAEADELLFGGTQLYLDGRLLTPDHLANLPNSEEYVLANDINGNFVNILVKPGLIGNGSTLTLVMFTNEIGVPLPWEGQDSVKSRGDEVWLNNEAQINRTGKIGYIILPPVIDDMTETHTDMNFAQSNQTSTPDETNIRITDIYSFFNTIYPIGSIYENKSNPTNPGKYMGIGTWVPCDEGRVIFGYKHGDPAFNEAVTGGQISVTLTAEHIPPTPVTPEAATVHEDATGDINITGCLPDPNASNVVPAASLSQTAQTANAEVTPNEFSIMPPYATAYRWVRVA